MSYRLASAIFRDKWAIAESAVQGYLPFINAIAQGKPYALPPMTEAEKKKLQPYEINYSAKIPNRTSRDFQAKSEGNTERGAESESGDTKVIEKYAVIPVIGTMVKYTEECGPVGMVDMAAAIERAARSDADGIILMIDSGGGQSDGTTTLSEAIKKAKTVKPVLSFVHDGMMASAAYSIGSEADKIIASKKTDMVGSVGVMATLIDYKAAMENATGAKVHIIYSSYSTKKNAEYHEAMEGKYEGMREKLLDPDAEEFINKVKANRAGKIKEDGSWQKGEIFTAEDALEQGLIDGIGSFEFALGELSALVKNKVNSNTTDMSLFGNKSKFQKVSALVGKEQVTEEDIKAANEELEAEGVKGAMLISLQDAETAKGLATQIEQATTKATSLEKQLEEMTAARDAIQAKFNARPGAEGTVVKAEQDKIEGAATTDDVADPNAEHNKEADDFLARNRTGK